MGVTLVSTVPLPANPVQTQNVLANESKGLSQSLPKPEVKEPDAFRSRTRTRRRSPRKKPARRRRSRKRSRWKKRTMWFPSARAVQSAGRMAFSARGGAKGGFGFTGGGGDFGTRFAWYVRVVQQKVSENWLKYEVDPRIQ